MKGHQGTCIKDMWTKPKGVGSKVEGGDEWGRGPWWGENGDNYLNDNKKIRFNFLSLIFF